MLAQKLGRVVVRDVTNMASFYVSSKEILSRVKVRRNSVSITLAWFYVRSKVNLEFAQKRGGVVAIYGELLREVKGHFKSRKSSP